MRQIKKIHQAAYEPIADLVTYRVLPTHSIQYIDPFLFLNHHGPQVYPQNNRGLPFGPHPHRGFETVTFILEGDIAHRDSHGNEGVILPGGIQWMTAGKGLIHSEISSDAFKKEGGKLEILQLWVNLPAKYKMVDPFYKDLQKEDIPAYISADGKVDVQIISGEWEGTRAAYKPLTDISIFNITLQPGGKFSTSVAPERNIFFYVIAGKVTVNGAVAERFQLVEFENTGNEISVEATEEAKILFGHAVPFNEPVVSQGPFVMNTQQEIMEAYNDYQQGKFGRFN